MFFDNGYIILSKDNKKNFISIPEGDYDVRLLDDRYSKSKGGNSFVYKLINPNDGSESVIKFSKYPRIVQNLKDNLRFQHEVDALTKANEKGFDNVVKIITDGVYNIGGFNFPYYIMEKADYDLTTFIKEERVAISQKLILCYDIIRGINQLHSMDLYHRDIKPDNIFFIDNTWKVGDLGLSTYRNQEPSLDSRNEKIGPYGWLSPEVMNKVLCVGTEFEKRHHCVIDKLSDIFQLGKLIWFIFNGNIPIGQVTYEDFILQRKNIFDLIFKMLQYNRLKRGQLDEYEEAFELLIN